MPDCRYCRDTGLSDYSSAGYIRSICNVCNVGKGLQDLLKLLASAQQKEPETVATVVKDLKRIVEA
jgi:hypothetical protein